MASANAGPKLPNYFLTTDFEAIFRRHPLPDDFERGMFRWPAERIHEHQDRLFREVMEHAWRNRFSVSTSEPKPGASPGTSVKCSILLTLRIAGCVMIVQLPESLTLRAAVISGQRPRRAGSMPRSTRRPGS